MTACPNLIRWGIVVRPDILDQPYKTLAKLSCAGLVCAGADGDYQIQASPFTLVDDRIEDIRLLLDRHHRRRPLFR